MNVTCPECRTVYRVDPARVVGARVRARCSVCGGVIVVTDQVQWGDDFPDDRLTSREPVRVATPVSVATAAQQPGGAPATETVTPPAVRVPPFAPPRRPTPGPSFVAPSFPASTIRPPTPSFTPAVAPPRGTFGAPLTPASAPVQAPPAVPRPSPVGTPITPVAAATPSPTPAPPPLVVRKPINPFLSNDPNQKARRLARALVSDMTAYHPQKRAEGERMGTLKQLFREEIKKSYEEYVEQVGREFAEATSHFQDALNEILASGKRLF